METTDVDRTDSGGAAPARRSRRWVRVLWIVAAVAGLAVVSERLAGWVFQRAEARLDSMRDRSHVTYWIDDSRLHFGAEEATNALRVAVIGNSLALGSMVFFADTFSARLERLLNLNPGLPPAVVEVHAEAGTNTRMQWRVFNAALKENPRIVLFAMSLNDVDDRGRGKKEMEAWQQETDPWTPPPWLDRALARSRTWKSALGFYQDWAQRRSGAPYYRHLYRDDYSGWVKFRQAIDGYRDECAQRGIAMGVVILPAMQDLDDYRLEFAHRKLQQRLREDGIPCLDLLDWFRGRSPLRMTAIPGRDAHLSEIAHRIAADVMFQFLIGAGFVPDTYAPVHLSEPREKYIERCRGLAADSVPASFPAPTNASANAATNAAPAAPAATNAVRPAAAAHGSARTVLRAKLSARIETPAPASIKPYKQALVVYVYDVEQVQSGPAPAEKRIAVAHWGIRDQKVVELGKRAGESYELALEPFAAHPELEGERTIIRDEDVPLPLFYEVGK